MELATQDKSIGKMAIIVMLIFKASINKIIDAIVESAFKIKHWYTRKKKLN